jgi:hypothetical protein
MLLSPRQRNKSRLLIRNNPDSKPIITKHELLSINTKIEWLCKKWHFVRAAALDDWAEISTNAEYRKMRYERHEYVHGGGRNFRL